MQAETKAKKIEFAEFLQKSQSQKTLTQQKITKFAEDYEKHKLSHEKLLETNKKLSVYKNNFSQIFQ